MTDNQESNTYTNNSAGIYLRNSINFQNGPTKLIPNDERYRTHKYSQDMNSYSNSGLIYSTNPGRIQLSNHNENFNPYTKGVCSKQAPFL